MVATTGRLGTPPLIAIQDSSAGIVVRLGDASPRPVLGSWIDVTGTLADPYGQLELRSIADLVVGSVGPIPAPITVDGATLGEVFEARLVAAEGVAQGRPIKSTSGDLTFIVATAHGSIRVVADASAGLTTGSVSTGDRVRLVGVVGQRASAKGALDGYRIWIRQPADLVRIAAPSGSPAPSAGPSASPTPTAVGGGPTVRSIAWAILAGSGTVTVEGSVTVRASLLDATNRRLIVQDTSAAIEVLLPGSTGAPPVGSRVRVTGEVGRAYGAPRIKSTSISGLGTLRAQPLDLRVAPGAAHEWRLVRVRGDVVEVHRSGDRWMAEVLVGGTRIPIVGLTGAGVPAAALTVGRTAVVTGIVRRPWPTATDRRYSVVPRSPGDLVVGGPADGGSSAGSTGGTSGGASSSRPGSNQGGPSSSHGTTTQDTDLVDLPARIGQAVHVSGLVRTIRSDGFDLDDGTAVVFVHLIGGAADVAGSIVSGDALGATGVVAAAAGGGGSGAGSGIVLEVGDPAAIVLVGSLGVDDPQPTAGPSGPSDPGRGQPEPSPGMSLSAGLGGPAVPALGVAGLVLAALASLAMTLLRRQRMRRRLAARISLRLASLAMNPGGGPTLRGRPAGPTFARSGPQPDDNPS